MALVKSRPKIKLKIPRELRPGDEFLATVVLECRRPVEIEHVEVVLEGTESWSVAAGDTSALSKRTLLRLGRRLGDVRRLPAGTTELSVRVALPGDAPPSVARSIEYEMSVHAAIAWWPDARARFEVKVVPNEVPSPPTEPQVFSSDPEGPREKERHIEVSLASSWVRAGGMVSGAFALSNVDRNRYSSVKIALRAVQTLFHGGLPREAREHVRYSVRCEVSQAREAEMIPFRFVLPADAPPEYAARPRPDGVLGLSALSWELEIVVEGHWSGDMTLRIPFRVLPRSDRPADAPLRIAPIAVGSDRLRGLWEAIGSQHGLRYAEQSLLGHFGETELVIHREHKGRDGVFLVAELAYPELFLELSVEPASAMRRLVGGDVRVGETEWDRDHVVRARDEQQSATFLRALLPALAGVQLRRLEDRGLAIALREAGQSKSKLAAFVAGATRLAQRFEELRRDLPPPTGMEAAVFGWRELARQLGGPLEAGPMRIVGALGENVIEVRLAFDASGRAVGTWLSVIPSSPVDDEHRFRWQASNGPASVAIAARFRGQLGELAAIVAHDADELDIGDERIVVRLPSALGFTLSFEVAERRIERLVQLATVLRGQLGPYR